MTKQEIPFEWLPSLSRRYTATVIDGLLVLLVLFATAALLSSGTLIAQYGRVAILALAVLVYEPLCTSRFTTLGQRIAGVRVRRFENGARIDVVRAYGRIILKILLGWISFLVIPLNIGRRAVHDMATGSIVITAAAEQDFAAWATGGRVGAGPESDQGI